LPPLSFITCSSPRSLPDASISAAHLGGGKWRQLDAPHLAHAHERLQKSRCKPVVLGLGGSRGRHEDNRQVRRKPSQHEMQERRRCFVEPMHIVEDDGQPLFDRQTA
jgi:hypothetical protein